MSEPEHLPKPVSAAPPPDRTVAEKRVAPFPTSVLLDEAIVGSSHAIPLVYPHVLDTRPTTAIVSIKSASAAVSRPNHDLERAANEMSRRRAEAFSPVDPTHIVEPGRELPVRFYPTFPGDHEADVQILLRWPDELVDLRTVRVYGHARWLDDAPARPLGGTRERVANRDHEPEIPTADLANVAEIHRTTLSNLYNETKSAATAVATNQASGLNVVSGEAQSYHRAPPKASWWESAAELALTVAIGSLAGGVSKVVAGSLANAKYTEVLLGDGIKEGLKWAGKKAWLSKSPDPSSNVEIAFFALQGSTLGKLANENSKLIDHENRRLQHVLVKDPNRAIAEMHALRQGFRATEPRAEEEQRKETTRQWLSLVGRSENGSETVPVNGEIRDTTKLGLAHSKTRGVLRIEVEREPFVVTSASIDGVSQEIANRLLTQKLSTEPIPMVITIRDGRAALVLTRDEVGRVRRSHAPEWEAQTHGAAQQYVDNVLAKPLREWGVMFITTDDATGTGS